MDPAEISWLFIRLSGMFVIGYFLGSWEAGKQYQAGYDDGARDMARAKDVSRQTLPET
jgi:hypothetical protein